MPAPGKPLFRINTKRYPSTMPIRRFLYRALAKIGFAKRDHKKFLQGLDPFSGGTWGLRRESCQYILDFMKDYPQITEYFK